MGGPPWKFIATAQGMNAANATLVTGKLTKTGGVDGTWDAGASTVQTIAGDGFVEMLATETNKYRMIGLNATDASVNFTDIDYGLLLDGVGTLTVYENGTLRGTFGTYATGDILRVERIGTQVRYYNNGELRYSSGVAATGAFRVDASLFGSSAVIDGIRFYDGTTKTWLALSWQNVTNITTATGPSSMTRRITFAAPTSVREGDHLIAIFAGQGPEFISASSNAWPFVNIFTSATNNRGFAVYRRIATAAEPSTYMFDLNVTQETLGALLIYRDLDPASTWVGGSATDHSAQTTFPCPSRTLTRYSDLYVGLALEVPSVGVIAPPSDSNERIEFTQNALGAPFSTLRLEAFDFAAEAIGATDTKRATMAAASGVAASFALQGMIAPGPGLYIPPGAKVLGLPIAGP